MSRSENRNATSLLAFRLTPEDRAVVDAAAAAAGIGSTTFARRAALRAAGATSPAYERRAPRADAAMLDRIFGELGRIGANINQIAKVANATGSAGTTAGAACLVILEELADFHAAIVAAFDEEAAP